MVGSIETVACIVMVGLLCLYGCHVDHVETIECMKHGAGYNYINSKCIKHEKEKK